MSCGLHNAPISLDPTCCYVVISSSTKRRSWSEERKLRGKVSHRRRGGAKVDFMELAPAWDLKWALAKTFKRLRQPRC